MSNETEIIRRHSCRSFDRHLKASSVPIGYDPTLREYFVSLANMDAIQTISFCPWCGSKLPRSLRSKWFNRVRRLGLEPSDDSIPEEMKSDEWWRNDPKLNGSTGG